jgi:hypothetical protein
MGIRIDIKFSDLFKNGVTGETYYFYGIGAYYEKQIKS